MFSIDRVQLCNFRSYLGPHEFTFPTQPGLYFLTGLNLVDPGLGPNAVGKSSLLDAIFWTLFGRTTRGLKAFDVVSRGQKGCAVAVTLTVGDKQAVIRRAQNPNALMLDETVVSQEVVDKYLRLNPESFLYSVILPQFGTSFFDLTPAQKLTVFSGIMELDFWLERSQEAFASAEGIKASCHQYERELGSFNGQLTSAKEDLEALKGKEAGADKAKAAAVKSLKADLAKFIKDDEHGIEDAKACHKALIGIQKKLEHIKSVTCPTCKQPIQHPDLKDLLKNKEDFDRKLSRLQHEQQYRDRQKEQLQRSIAAEAERVNLYSEMIAEKKQKILSLNEAAEKAQVAIDNLNEMHTAVSYWINGFKRIRLFIIEETLRQLEVEVNNSLVSLGLTGWIIGLDVERENKAGGVTKGFTVMIYPPGSDEPVKYESYSGGEVQRLRLAGDLGLANLIMERAGLSNTIEYFDEPSMHLSQEGLLDLAETLAQRAESQGKRILLVDHNIIDFSGFTATYMVVKDQAGSRISSAGAA